MTISFKGALTIAFLLGSLTGPPLFAMEPFAKSCIQIDQTPFQVEVAKTAEQKSRGLQHRSRLGKNQGMLFLIGEPTVQTFWMKDCRIPLDMLFFREGTLVSAVDSAPPCRQPANTCPIYSSGVDADMVVELNAGTRKRLQFGTGSKITLCPGHRWEGRP